MGFPVSKLFRAYRLYNAQMKSTLLSSLRFQSSFELTGYITLLLFYSVKIELRFKALSSLQVI